MKCPIRPFLILFSLSCFPGLASAQAEPPALWGLSAITLPESEADTGAAFTLVRPEGFTGAFTLLLGYSSPLWRNETAPPAKYRFTPADPWLSLPRGAASLQIPFAAGENSRVIHLAAHDDISWDPKQKPGSVILHHSGSPETWSVIVKFPDNDPPPNLQAHTGEPPVPGAAVTLLQESAAGAPQTVSFYADRPSTVALRYSVSVAAAASSATTPGDFEVNGGTVNLATGARIANGISVNTVNDSIVEGDETIVFHLTCVTPDVPVHTAEALIMLSDNDFHQISVGDASVVEGNTGLTELRFPVTLAAPADRDLTFQWTASEGTATAGSDFPITQGHTNMVSGTATIPAGAVSAILSVSVTGDTLMEPDETIRLELTPPSPATAAFLRAVATGTILSDDLPSVTVASAAFPENALFPVFTATLSEPAPFDASVQFALESGTAQKGQDFVLTDFSFEMFEKGTFFFPAGSVTATSHPSVHIEDDIQDETDETFTLRLLPSPQLKIGRETTEFTILDNDSPVLLNPGITEAVEGDVPGKELEIVFPISGGSAYPASVDWTVSAGSSAVASASGTLIFTPGQQNATVKLALLGNLIPEETRTVKLQLSNFQNLAADFSEVTVASVLDDDGRTISGEGVTVSEGDAGGVGTATFRLSMEAALSVPVSVSYATVAGTATAGQDFSSVNGTAVIPAGATEALIPVSIVGDAVFEGPEAFTLALRNPVNATLALGSLTATITDDDAQPALSVSRATVTTAAEGGPFRAWISATLGSATPVAASYRVTTRDDTAIAGVHYTAVNGGVLTFRPGGPEGPSWIALAVPNSGDATARKFFVDFTPLSGPVTTVTAEVSILPLQILDFKPVLLGLYTLRFPTGVGQNYIIQEAESLAGPWVDNSSILTGSGSPVLQVVSSENERAFFRVRSYTNPPATPVSLTP